MILVMLLAINSIVTIATIGLEALPLNPQQSKLVAIVLGVSTLLVAFAFHLTANPSTTDIYCASLVHASWSWWALVSYPSLVVLASFLLQAYNKVLSSLYFLLILLPLSLFSWLVKAQCMQKGPLLLDDLLQSVTLFITFPPIAVILGCLLLVWFGFAIRRDRTKIWSAIALFGLFLLLQQHAFDWLPFILEA